MMKTIVSLSLLTLLAPLAAACGGGGAEAEAGGDETTAGGEHTEAVGDAGNETPDPCAESTEPPCDEGAVAARGGPESAEGEDGEGAEGEDGEGEDGEDGAEGAEGRGAEGGAMTREEWAVLVRTGRQWFNRRCDTCHPGGEEDIGPTLMRIRWTVPRMRRQIRQGSGRMRPIPAARLPEEHMDALMAYMSTFGAVRGVRRPE